MGLPRLNLFERGELFVGQAIKDLMSPARHPQDADRQRARWLLVAKNLASVGPADANLGCQIGV